MCTSGEGGLEVRTDPGAQSESSVARNGDGVTGQTDDEPTIRLERWNGHWAADDPDANFKADVALYSSLDPLATLEGLSRSVQVPMGALARYVLAKYATSGSGGLLELGPVAVRRLQAFVDAAERDGTDEARLAAYDALRAFISWLALPLDEPGGY